MLKCEKGTHDHKLRFLRSSSIHVGHTPGNQDPSKSTIIMKGIGPHGFMTYDRFSKCLDEISTNVSMGIELSPCQEYFRDCANEIGIIRALHDYSLWKECGYPTDEDDPNYELYVSRLHGRT